MVFVSSCAWQPSVARALFKGVLQLVGETSCEGSHIVQAGTVWAKAKRQRAAVDVSVGDCRKCFDPLRFGEADLGQGFTVSVRVDFTEPCDMVIYLLCNGS